LAAFGRFWLPFQRHLALSMRKNLQTLRKMASENVEKSKKNTSMTSISTNSFANDGSFLEMYKQRIKEQENTADEKKDVKVETEKRKTTNLLLQV
jgi:hypothetical protein